jgi:hypothetical protein
MSRGGLLVAGRGGLLAALLALLVASPALAHNADIATYTVVRIEQGWVLQVQLPTAALVASLDAPQQGRAADRLGAAAEAAIRGGTELRMDGRPVPLGAALVGVGPHETRLQFALAGIDGPGSLEGSRLAALADGPNQHNVLRLVEAAGPSQWVLAARNGFTLDRAVPASRGSLRR